MVNKKGGKTAKGGKSKPPLNKKPQQPSRPEVQAHQQTPQERVSLVRPLWETLEQDERVNLLTVDLESVRSRARQLAEAARKQAVADAPEGEPLDPALLELEPSIEDVLEEGIKRLKEKGTWKLWQWPADNAAMYDAESFRQHITEKHIREELRRLLPRDEGRATEKPAEAAFRQRMLDLLAKVQQSSSANSLRPTVTASGDEGAGRPHRRRGDPGSHLRDANVELLAILLEALARENDHLYHSLLTPITTYVMEILPEGHRETTKLELSFEDLENLLPDDVSRIVEWLTEKVDALSTKLKPEPKDEEEEEEENMGDVDLWALAESDTALTVNGRWLQHLQDRLLGEDGHPRRAKAGEDPARNGLVLEWVYGSIVSTAEKARDGAKRCLGMQPPTAMDAHITLVRALEEHLSWESRAKQCKDLLSEMLKSRLEAAELTKQGYDLRPQPAAPQGRLGGDSGPASLTSPLLLEDASAAVAGESKPLPDEVILFMLRREALLTRAKLHWLVFEHLTQEKELRILKQQLRQGEPEFERLKRELDEVKHQPRMEGAYRNAAEMERHRHQVEIQTAFREQGARLQATYDKKQKAEYEMAKRETEIKQLQGWKGTVENLVDKFQELINSRNERMAAASSAGEGPRDGGSLETDGDLEAAAGSLTPQQYIQLTKMRNHFIKDVRKQLYGDSDDRLFFDNLKTALKAIERRLEDSSVALQHLEMQLINVACDDPGALIGTQLALPLLQDRLDARGLEYAAQRAKLAEDEVLKMELLAAEREAAERERKKAAKAKKNEKAKSEKERLAAERQAKEEAERRAKEEAERERVEREEEERRKRVEAVEAQRKAAEAEMERRRKELLEDPHGYWRQRMMLEQRLSGMGVSVDREGAGTASSSEPTEEPERPASVSPEDCRPEGEGEEGFVTESRWRRHKDARDQDDEAAPPAPAPGSAGARGNARSGSRDRAGPRDGSAHRERGEQPHAHHNHRERDREPRRHHGSSHSSHRSGSREVASRHSGSQGGAAAAAPPPPRPHAAPAAPAPLSSAAAPAPRPEPAVPAAAPPSPAPPTPSESSSEQPSEPAAAAPVPASPATQPQAATAAAAAPSASASGSDAMPAPELQFGSFDMPIPVPSPVPVPVPVPVASAPQALEPATADSRPAAPADAQAVPTQQPAPTGGREPAAPAPAASASALPAPQQQQQQAQPPQQAPQHHPQQQQAGQPPQGPAPSQSGQPQPPVPAPMGQPGQAVHPMVVLPPGPIPGSMPGMVHGAPMPMMPPMGGPPPAGQAAGPRPVMGAPPQYLHPNGPMPMHGGHLRQLSGPPPPPGTVLLQPATRPPVPGHGMPPGMPPQVILAQPQPGAPMVRAQVLPAPGPQVGLVMPHPQGPPGQPPQQGMPPNAAPRGGPGPQQFGPMAFPPPGHHLHAPGMAPPHGHPAAPPGAPVGQAAPPPHGVYAYPAILPAVSGQLMQHPQPHILHSVMPQGAVPVHIGPAPIQLQQQQPQQAGMQGVAPGGQPPPPPKSPSSAASGNRGSKPSSTLSAAAAPFVPKGSAPTASSGASSGSQQQQQSGPSNGAAQQGQRSGYQRQNSVGAGEPGNSGAAQAPPPPGQQQQGPYPRGGQGQAQGSPYSGRRDRRDAPRGGAGARDGSTGGMGGAAGGRKGPAAGAAGAHGMMPQQPVPVEVQVGQPMPHYPFVGIPQPAMLGPQPWLPHGHMVLQPPPMPHGHGMEQGDGSNATGLTHVVGPLERRASSGPDDSGRPPASAESASGQPGSAGLPMPPMPPPAHGAGPGPQHIPQPPVMPALPSGMGPPGGGRPMLTPPGMPMALPGPMRPPMMGAPIQMVVVPMPPSGPYDAPEHLNAEAAELVRAPRTPQPPAAVAASAADGEGSHGGSDSAATASATAPNIKPTEGDATARQERQAPSSAHSKDEAPCTEAAAGAPAKPGPQEQGASPALMQRDAAGESRHQNGRAPAAAPSTAAPAAAGPSGRQVPAAPQPASTPPSWSAVAARREAPAAAGTSASGGYQEDAFPSLLPSGAAASDSAHPAGTIAVSSSSWKAKLQQNVAAAASAASVASGNGRSPTALPNSVPGGARGSSPRAMLNGGLQLAASLSDGAMAHSSGGGASQPPRPPGNRPSGSALLTGPPSQLGGSLSLPSAAPASNVTVGPGAAAPAIMYHPGAGGKPRRLQLLRGLQNLGGQNNCFLNVTLQSLWHLQCFRNAMLGMDVEAVAARGAAPSDVAVLSSLVGIFRAMAAPVAEADAWAVSPAPLREALSALKAGQAAVQLERGEMHDASEVLDVLLTCMHRAEAGSGAAQGQDPQLPRRMRVRAITAAAANGVLADGHAAPVPAAPQGAAGYAAAVAGSKGGAAAGKAGAAALADAGVPSTAVHSLFGLEVQRAVPSAIEDDDASSSGSSGGGLGKGRARRDSCNGVVAAPESMPAAAPPARQGSGSGGGGGRTADASAATEVEVFTKWHHLIHVPPLREAFAALGGTDGGAYFEDVLCAAEAAGAGNLLRGGVTGGGRRAPSAAGGGQGVANGHGPAGGWVPGATAASHPLATLLRFPLVFTLALGWESAKATPDKLRPALEALGPRLDLALLFRCGGGAAPHSAPCELRSVICYGDHHYMVFALSEELGLWLLIDDANIQLVGDWGNVVKAMWARRLQPSLLFYEAERGAQALTQPAV